MIVRPQDIPEQQPNFTAYSHFWLVPLSSLADVLRAKLGMSSAFDLLREIAEEQGGWTPKLQYLGLRLLKPAALPLGSDVAA
jgi:hypothetical protein